MMKIRTKRGFITYLLEIKRKIVEIEIKSSKKSAKINSGF